MDYSDVVLNRTNGASLYLQLAEALAKAVAGGALALGQRLPSERELAGILGVSRTTVVTAYRELEARGLARGHVGRGTFVVGGAGGDDDGAPFAWRGKPASGARRFSDPALRELVEEAGPGTVSFGPGTPALDRFPMDTIRRLTDRVLRRGAEASLGLLPTEGHPPLREALAARCCAGPSEVLVVSGAQQGLDLVTRCLVEAGDAVVMDRPGYLGAVQTFLSAGASVVGWDFERSDPGELEDLLIRHRPKLIYTNPTFQNPTGLTLPLPKRREFLRVARRHRVAVVEDEPYRDLPFPGTPAPPPTLRELDEGGLVIHLGTFSKTLAAGLRLGWGVALEAVVDQLALVKARSDLFGNAVSLLVVAEMLSTDLFDEHAASLREEHERRYRALVPSLGRRRAPCRGVRSTAACTCGVARRRPASTRLDCKGRPQRPGSRSSRGGLSTRMGEASATCDCATRDFRPRIWSEASGFSPGSSRRSPAVDLAAFRPRARWREPIGRVVRSAATKDKRQSPGAVFRGRPRPL